MAISKFVRVQKEFVKDLGLMVPLVMVKYDLLSIGIAKIFYYSDRI